MPAWCITREFLPAAMLGYYCLPEIIGVSLRNVDSVFDSPHHFFIRSFVFYTFAVLVTTKMFNLRVVKESQGVRDVKIVELLEFFIPDNGTSFLVIVGVVPTEDSFGGFNP